jgi:hypothetical protein
MTIRNLTQCAALAVACSALTAQAGVAPAPAPPPPEPVSLWSGSVTLGYDSEYIYRGVEIFGNDGRAKDLVTGALDLNYAINDRLSWNFNAWYGSSASDADYNELDLYTRLTFKVNDSFSFGPSFKYYYYPAFDGTNYDEQFEPGLEFFFTPCPNTNISLGAFYETESEAFYAELNINYTWKLCEKFSLVPGALVSYVDRDNSAFAPSSSDFNHAAFYLRAPYTFKPGVTLTPYILLNVPMDGAEDAGDFLGNDQDEELIGGVAFSVGF